jgi:hypothetical protein
LSVKNSFRLEALVLGLFDNPRSNAKDLGEKAADHAVGGLPAQN